MHIQVINAQKTMTSREIAELTSKDHKNVLADIRKMLADLGSAENSANLPDAYGRPQPVILLDKEQSICLVAGYSAPLRMAIIRRWQELESKQLALLPDFSDPVAAARAWADAKESEQKALANLEAAKPAISFVENYVVRDRLQTATQVAQTIGMSAVKMNSILDDIGGVYNKSVKRTRVFCKSFVDNGYGEMKQTEMGYTQPLFTTSGAFHIAEKLTAEGVL